MKLTALISLILVTTIGLVSNSSGLPHTGTNAQLKQAFGAQGWGRTIQAVNQVNRGTMPKPKSNSKLTLYQALLTHK